MAINLSKAKLNPKSGNKAKINPAAKPVIKGTKQDLKKATATRAKLEKEGRGKLTEAEYKKQLTNAKAAQTRQLNKLKKLEEENLVDTKPMDSHSKYIAAATPLAISYLDNQGRAIRNDRQSDKERNEILKDNIQLGKEWISALIGGDK